MSPLLNRTITAAIWCVLCPFVSAEERLIVHAWGTFTLLQDESGKAIGGINVDDVPVSETLHKIAPGSLLPVGPGGQPTPEEARCHLQVTMRLERAAINFYPAADFNSPLAVRSDPVVDGSPNICPTRSSNRPNFLVTISARSSPSFRELPGMEGRHLGTFGGSAGAPGFIGGRDQPATGAHR